MSINPLLIPLLALMIPIVAIGFSAFKRWMDMKERLLEQQSSLTAEKAAQYAAHTERLEQRVRVLERVITDSSITVANEIESLRDRADH
ncbi:MAG: hypothetical protein AABZ45_07015 [Pseudomonadota bacterium]